MSGNRRGCASGRQRFDEPQHRGGRSLFAGAPGAANAALGTPEFDDFAFHVEALLVSGAQRRYDPITRQAHPAGLQPFLQFGFRILADRVHLRIDLDIPEKAAHQFIGFVKAGIEVDSADDSFQRVGQHGRPILSTGARLALAQPQHVRQAKLDCEAVKRILLDKVGANTRKVAFGQFSELLVKERGDGKV